jgi:hypothetical protein
MRRPLALVVGRLDVAARQEHQQLVARRHARRDNGRQQVAALDIGRLEARQVRGRRRCRVSLPVLCERSRRARTAPQPISQSVNYCFECSQVVELVYEVRRVEIVTNHVEVITTPERLYYFAVLGRILRDETIVLLTSYGKNI